MKGATVFGKTLFILLLCVAVLCVVGKITFKIIDKEMQSVLDNLLYALKGWGNVLKITFTDNALAMGKALIDEPLTYVYKNFLSVMKQFGGNFKDLGESIAAVSIVAWEHFKDFWEILSKAAVKCWSHLKGGWSIIKEVGLRIADNVKEFYNRIKDLFA